VLGRRGAHDDEVDVRTGHELLVVVEGVGDAVFRGELLRLVQAAAGDGDDLDPGDQGNDQMNPGASDRRFLFVLCHAPRVQRV